jgi:hypothetical protein
LWRAASLTIGDATVTEGDAGPTLANFAVTRGGPTTGTVTVNWYTANNTATAGTDYVAVPVTGLTFNPGETAKVVSVTINGDTGVEPNETYMVRLTNAVGAAITDGSGLGRITNDDSGTFSVNDVTVNEGNSGTTVATFTVGPLRRRGRTRLRQVVDGQRARDGRQRLRRRRAHDTQLRRR